jgi:hypothetical protein
MSPRELLTTHTSRDLSEWQAYFRVLAVEAQRPSRGRETPLSGEEGVRQLNAVFDRMGR